MPQFERLYREKYAGSSIILYRPTEENPIIAHRRA